MNALLRRFVELIEADLTAAGFVRRGPVFRYFDAEGNGIALDIQRTTTMPGEAAFYLNAGVLLAPHLRFYFGDEDPSRDAMPHHSVWQHRLTGPDEGDHKFVLSTDADVEPAATVVRTWLRENLPRLTSWLGDCDAMLAAIEEEREQAERTGRWADGHWSERVIRVFAYAERGDVDAVTAETADWPSVGRDGLAADALALADRRRTERQG